MKIEKEIRKELDKRLAPPDFLKISASLEGASKRRITPTWKKVLAAGSLSAIVLAGTGTGLYFGLQERLDPANPSYSDYPVHANRQELKLENKDNIASRAVELLSPFLDVEGANRVLSPASFALCMGASLKISTHVEDFAKAMGFSQDVDSDFNALFDGLNWVEEQRGGRLETASSIRTAALVQQVGDTFRIDPEKAEEVGEGRIPTCISTSDSYLKDAEKVFEEAIGLELSIPNKDNPPPMEGLVIYNALKLQDSLKNPEKGRKQAFHAEDGSTEEGTFLTLSPETGETYSYYKGENYSALRVPVRFTDLLYILPDEGYTLLDVDLSKAYDAFTANNYRTLVEGYYPHFEASTYVELSSILNGLLNGEQRWSDRILEDGVPRILFPEDILQISTFRFDENGVAGESLTYMTEPISPGPGGDEEEDYVLFECDRPFYCISLYDDFPLFINRIATLS